MSDTVQQYRQNGGSTKRSVTGRNRLAVAHLTEIMRDVLTTETALSELMNNNTDFADFVLGLY
jgi:hypothetical protein